MAVAIKVPEKKQETSMGRRLLGMAAPLIGGAFGGPAGAAAGGAIGAKLQGGSTQDSLVGGVQAFNAAPSAGSAPQAPANLSSPFGRRMDAKMQDPQMAIQQGLDALPSLPKDLRDQYTKPLVQAQMGYKPRF